MDALRLWTHLFGKRSGLLCLTTAQRTGDELVGWSDRFFDWPNAGHDAAATAIAAASEGRDVFFVASLLQMACRRKGSALPISALFVDGDDAGEVVPPNLPQPTAVVESSQGRRHWYWALTTPLQPQDAETLNRQLALAVGGDLSGWDATQLLRVPGTTNYKYPDMPKVRLLSIDASLSYCAKDFGERVSAGHSLKENLVPDRRMTVAHSAPPIPLSGMALDIWRGNSPVSTRSGALDRSATLYKIGAALAEAGAPTPSIVESLAERDASLGYHKYTKRTDAMQQYYEIAQRVTETHHADEAGLPADLHHAILTEELTDQRVAECVSAWYGDELRYAPDRGVWLEWQGTRWAVQADNAAVRQRIVATARRLQQIAFAEAQGPANNRDLLTQAFRIQNNRKTRDVAETLRSLPTMRRNFGDFDANPWLLNVANGTVNLKTGALQPHDPADLITNIAPVEYDSQAQAPQWEAFLQQVFCGDTDLIDYVQRLIGYSLTGMVSERAIFILYGAGRNGKSVFLETLRELLGEYASAFDPGVLTLHKHEKHPAGLAVLAGKRLVYAQETAEGSRLNEAQVKSLTGGDTVPVRLMHENPWEMKPTFTIFLSTNSKPVIGEQGPAIWERLKPIPFRHTVAPEERVPAHVLLRRFAVEEGAGVLRWAVDGCLRYLADGTLTEPPVIAAEVEEYKQDMDILGSFLDDYCVTGEGRKVLKTWLYQRYAEWCRNNGLFQMNSLTFNRRLAERGFEGRNLRYRGRHDTKSTKGQCWAGLGLREDVDSENMIGIGTRNWSDPQWAAETGTPTDRFGQAA